jgi:hypothetical protein
LQKQAETLFWIFITKRQPKIVKTISDNSKGTILILKAFETKYSYRDTVPLRLLVGNKREWKYRCLDGWVEGKREILMFLFLWPSVFPQAKKTNISHIL